MNQDMAASIMESNMPSKEQPLLAHEVTNDKIVNLHQKREPPASSSQNTCKICVVKPTTTAKQYRNTA